MKEKNLKDEDPSLPFEQKKGEERRGDISEALGRIAKMRKANDGIRQKLHEFYEKTGWSPKQLESYLSDSHNFTQKEWEDVQKQRQALRESLQNLPKDKQKIRLSRSKISKERRMKMAAARRRWLPMS